LVNIKTSKKKEVNKMKTEKIQLDYDDLNFLEHQINDLLNNLIIEQKKHMELRNFANKEIQHDINSWTKILKKLTN
jgi:hypothetical protein|tara:strand:- start:585 stop:812 length:228 start_codon:yes stop_codon:yes gene_type:complete